jgi:hypothetical protein
VSCRVAYRDDVIQWPLRRQTTATAQGLTCISVMTHRVATRAKTRCVTAAFGPSKITATIISFFHSSVSASLLSRLLISLPLYSYFFASLFLPPPRQVMFRASFPFICPAEAGAGLASPKQRLSKFFVWMGLRNQRPDCTAPNSNIVGE